jgi:aspartyl-tRNA(Asn)/glutamyl-tRNA(Gln) amidotransferase subunit A
LRQESKYSACGLWNRNVRSDGHSGHRAEATSTRSNPAAPASAIDAMSDDLPFRSLTELSRLLASGETTSRAIVEACLARIDAHDGPQGGPQFGQLHAFIEVYRDSALAAADLADRQRRAGTAHGPLAGLPVALKDLLHVEGRQTTAGSKSWRGRISDRTATAVERLIGAGMIPLGKTHMVEFAFGGWGRNRPMGAPWNPWDMTTHRVAGGSSSGSAVAVAGGLCPAAIGSDTGGSIRIPAALCGITGLKPTYGRVSLYGAVPLSGTLDSIGPLARTVEDAALLTSAMSGPDPRDPATLEAPRGDLDAALEGEPDVRGVRITALAPESFPAFVLPEVVRVYREAIATLRDLGAQVVEAAFPLDFDKMMVENGRIIAVEAYAFHRDYIEDPDLDIDPWVRMRVLAGKTIGADEHANLLRERQRVIASFAHWMRDRDALLTPTLPITATPLNEVDEATTPLATWTRSANYLGACALSLPAGFSAERLPIGVQVTGIAFADPMLVRIGRAFQGATDWHLRRPD